MDMKPVIRPPSTSLPNEAANAQPRTQQPATSRPFVNSAAFQGVPFSANAPQPTQVFVSQARAQQAAPAAQPQQQQPANPGAAVPGQVPAGQFEKAVSQVITFFFGHKKDKTEEKERRERDDFARTGLFGEERKVEETNKSNMGGGQS